MLSTSLRTLIIPALVLALPLASAHAQERGSASADRHLGFIEVSGAFGFNFGVQDYLPDDDPMSFKHPITTSFALDATVGWELLRGLALIGSYELTNASSRKGSIPNVLDRVEGDVTYHTIVVGVRANRRLGPGHLGSQFAVGILLPFETHLDFDYGPALAALPEPIEGSGERTSEYNLGFGAHGQLGYYVPIVKGFYLGAALRVHAFQTNNNGKSRILENFVVDFTAPSAVNADIEFDDQGGERPENYSVQAVRLYVSAGYRF